MITVRQKKDGFERIGGNPVVTSLDGKRKARLRVIMHPSWTAEERAAFGIHQADPVKMPDGKQVAGQEHFERKGGKLVQIVLMQDKPAAPKATARQKVERMLERYGVTIDDLKGVLS